MDSLVTAWSGKLASFWYQTITSAQELSSWSRSLESDATVRADYALTTTTTNLRTLSQTDLTIFVIEVYPRKALRPS